MMTSLFRFLILVLAGISSFLPAFSQTAVKCDDVPGSSNDLHVFKNPKNEKDGFYMVTTSHVANKYWIVQVDNNGKIYDKERVQVELKTVDGLKLEYEHIDYFGDNIVLFGLHTDKKQDAIILYGQPLNNDGTHKGSAKKIGSFTDKNFHSTSGYYISWKSFQIIASTEHNQLLIYNCMELVNPSPAKKEMDVNLSVFDQKLNSKWERTIQLPKDALINDIIISEDGIIMLCYTYLFENKELISQILIIKDKSSDITELEIGVEQGIVSSLQLRENSKNGVVSVIGSYYTKKNNPFPEGIYYCQINSSGKIITENKIPLDDAIRKRMKEFHATSFTYSSSKEKDHEKPNLNFMIKDFYAKESGGFFITGRLYYGYLRIIDNIYKQHWLEYQHDVIVLDTDNQGNSRWMKSFMITGGNEDKGKFLRYRNPLCGFYTVIDDKNGIQVVYNSYTLTNPKNGKELKELSVLYRQFSPDGSETQSTLLLPEEKKKNYYLIAHKSCSDNKNHFLRMFVNKNVSGGNISNGYYVKFTPKK